MAVGAHVVGLDSCHERSLAALTEAIADQRAASACSAASTTAGGAGIGFQEIDCSGDTGAELRILTLRDAGDRDDAILQAVEIDLHGDGRAGCSRRGRVGIVRAATASAAAASCGRVADAFIFVALGKNGAGLAFFEHGQIEAEVLVVIVGGHVEPLRLQTEIGGGEKPQILAAGVPGGPDGIGQAVGDLLFLSPVSTLLMKMAW